MFVVDEVLNQDVESLMKTLEQVRAEFRETQKRLWDEEMKARRYQVAYEVLVREITKTTL